MSTFCNLEGENSDFNLSLQNPLALNCKNSSLKSVSEHCPLSTWSLDHLSEKEARGCVDIKKIFFVKFLH